MISITRTECLYIVHTAAGDFQITDNQLDSLRRRTKSTIRDVFKNNILSKASRKEKTIIRNFMRSEEFKDIDALLCGAVMNNED